jgi:hypothetical protein
MFGVIREEEIQTEALEGDADAYPLGPRVDSPLQDRSTFRLESD